ncbi:hypothetical protein D3C71_1838550 [compost metagenome]
MNGRTLEKLATVLLLFVGFGVPTLLWLGGSAAGIVAKPYDSGLFGNLLVVGLILMAMILYPVIKMVEGIQVARYCRGMAAIDEMEKELAK